MSKIALSELLSDADTAKKAETADGLLADKARMEEATRQLEAGSAASALVCIARIDALVDGIPSSIHLECPNGHLKGVYLKRIDGKWTVSCPDPWSRRVNASETVVIEAVMRALGIDVSPASVKAVRAKVGWSRETLAADIVSAFGGVGGHVAEGLFRQGYELKMMFGFKDEERLAVELAKAAAASGVALDEHRSHGRPDIVSSLTMSINLPYLMAMIDVAGAEPGPKALHNAVHYGNAEGVGCILATGLPADTVCIGGKTALHLAAELALEESSHSNALEVIAKLIAHGASPEATDDGGRTAADIIDDGLADIAAGRLDGMHTYTDSLEDLRHSLTHGKRTENTYSV